MRIGALCLAGALVALASCAGTSGVATDTPDASVGEPARCAPLLPPAREPLVLRGTISLAELVDEWARVTGLVAIVDPDTRAALARKAWRRHPIGEDDVTIPREDVHPFVERLLVAARCVVLDVHAGEPRTVRVVSLETSHADWVIGDAAYVPLEELERYRGRPAMLVTTLFPLRHGEEPASRVANVLRSMRTDTATQEFAWLGERALVLTDYAPQLVERVEILRASGL